MTNALFHADRIRQLPEVHPHRQAYREEMATAAAGQRRFPWRELEEVQQTARQDFSGFGTGRNAQLDAQKLAGEAQEWTARSSVGRRKGAGAAAMGEDVEMSDLDERPSRKHGRGDNDGEPSAKRPRRGGGP
jgi:hypothetical protein